MISAGGMDRGGHHHQVGLVVDALVGQGARAPRPGRPRPSAVSTPLTRQPWSRRAIPTEPPMSPVPKIMARPGCGGRPPSTGSGCRRRRRPQSGRSSRSPWAPSR